jgi:hypothetical protein
MTINIEFLDGLYRRKHEHLHALSYYENQVEIHEAKVMSAKTDRATQRAIAEATRWVRCVDGAKDRLLHVEVIIREYIETHGAKS